MHVSNVYSRTALPAASLWLGLAFAGLQSGCSKPQALLPAEGVSNSQGTVKATAGENGKTNIAIRVKHLIQPSKLAKDAITYVVWLQARYGDKQNIGALMVDGDLEGSLDTVSSLRHFEISVTPEPSGFMVQPTHAPIFTATVRRDD